MERLSQGVLDDPRIIKSDIIRVLTQALNDFGPGRMFLHFIQTWINGYKVNDGLQARSNPYEKTQLRTHRKINKNEN